MKTNKEEINCEHNWMPVSINLMPTWDSESNCMDCTRKVGSAILICPKCECWKHIHLKEEINN